MTLAQISALIEAENDLSAPSSPQTERGTTSDLMALAAIGG